METSGPVQACNGIALPLPLPFSLQNIKVFRIYITENTLSFGSASHRSQNPVPMDAYKPILLKPKSVAGRYLNWCHINKWPGKSLQANNYLVRTSQRKPRHAKRTTMHKWSRLSG